MFKHALRYIVCLAGVTGITAAGYRLVPINATTAGFLYILLVLIVASTWGLFEAVFCSICATLVFNFAFLPPTGTFTVADPQNWVALFSFLGTSIIASQLSTQAKRRALEALERQQDLERLYTFSRSILLSGNDEPFPKQLIRSLAETFDLTAAVLYDRRTGEFFRAGPGESQKLDQRLREASLSGTSFSGDAGTWTITALRLGADPMASLGLEGRKMPDSVLQGIGNLVAIGLERSRAQEQARQAEVERQSETLRTSLIDAMAHDFKTPLTVIKAATSSVLAQPEHCSASAREQLTLADEEAEHLRQLVDDTIEMGRLLTTEIQVHLEQSNLEEVVQDVIRSMRIQIEDRPLRVTAAGPLPPVRVDRRLLRLALKQLLDNALKYSAPDSGIEINIKAAGYSVVIDVVDHGPGIERDDMSRLFERFYRGQSVRHKIPGSGLGLHIANSIMKAHRGELTFQNSPPDTTFCLSFPADSQREDPA